MRTAREPQEVQALRDEMLSHALDILAEEGFDKLTMRSLARRMSMTAPNLYNYFSGKEEIYITLMLNGFDALTAAVERDLATCADDTSRARTLMRTYVEFGLKHPRLYGLMFSADTPKYQDFAGTEHEALSAREHALSMRLVEIGEDVIAGLAREQDGALTQESARAIVASVWSFVHGLVSLANSDNLQYVAKDPRAILALVTDRLLEATVR